MEHKAYIRINRDAATAIVLIHGIVGTPNHFNELIPLIPDSVSVYNLLLDGHGKDVKAFSATSMKKWESQVTAVVEQLARTHEEIVIVAHSLGTLLAIDQAIRNETVSKLFLLAVPLRLSLKPKMFINSIKVYFDKIKPTDYEALAAKNCYGIENDKNLFLYMGWIPRFMELFAKILQTRRTIHLLHTPCWVYQSRKDEMVSGKSIQYLKQNSCITVNELKHAGHYYYHPEDMAYLKREFVHMLSGKSVGTAPF